MSQGVLNSGSVAETTTETRSEFEKQVLYRLAELVERVRRLDETLTEFKPIIDQYRSPMAAYVSSRRAKRNGG